MVGGIGWMYDAERMGFASCRIRLYCWAKGIELHYRWRYALLISG